MRCEETLATTLYDEFAEEEVARAVRWQASFPRPVGSETRLETWKQGAPQRGPPYHDSLRPTNWEIGADHCAQ